MTVSAEPHGPEGDDDENTINFEGNDDEAELGAVDDLPHPTSMSKAATVVHKRFIRFSPFARIERSCQPESTYWLGILAVASRQRA